LCERRRWVNETRPDDDCGVRARELLKNDQHASISGAVEEEEEEEDTSRVDERIPWDTKSHSLPGLCLHLASV
jgi:hypothetical protein